MNLAVWLEVMDSKVYDCLDTCLFVQFLYEASYLNWTIWLVAVCKSAQLQSLSRPNQWLDTKVLLLALATAGPGSPPARSRQGSDSYRVRDAGT